VALTGVASLTAVHSSDIEQHTHSPADPPRIIIDSDYNTLNDDGQLSVMVAQLQTQGLLEVSGITVVSVHQWLKQGLVDALKAVRS